MPAPCVYIISIVDSYFWGWLVVIMLGEGLRSLGAQIISRKPTFSITSLLTLKVIINSGQGFNVALAHGSELKFCNKSSMNGGSQ